MRRTPWISTIFGILGAIMLAGAILVAVFCRNGTPVLLSVPREASAQVEKVMQAVCDGDYAAAETMIYGNPDLGMDMQLENAVNEAFWNAFVSSLDYELVGQMYATESGLAQNVKITGLELSAATENLRQRAEELLEQGVKQAENAEDIYDDKNGYKDSFVAQVMQEAARQALEADVGYTEQVVTVQLIFDEQWWVVADKALLNAISGGTVG